MAKVIAKKILTLIPVLLVVSFLTYIMLDFLPGDPALQVLGPQGISPEAIAAVRADLRLDDPCPSATWAGWATPSPATSGAATRAARRSPRRSWSASP